MYHDIVFALLFFSCAFVFCLLFSVPFFMWLEHDGCCSGFFVFSLFFLSLTSYTRSYLFIEIIVSVA